MTKLPCGVTVDVVTVPVTSHDRTEARVSGAPGTATGTAGAIPVTMVGSLASGVVLSTCSNSCTTWAPGGVLGSRKPRHRDVQRSRLVLGGAVGHESGDHPEGFEEVPGPIHQDLVGGDRD